MTDSNTEFKFQTFAVLVAMLIFMLNWEEGCAQDEITGAGYFCFEKSVPFGDFGVNNGDPVNYGVAQSGMVFGLDASFPLKGRMGISARFSNMVWNSDVNAISDYLNQDKLLYTALVAYPWKNYNILFGLNTTHSLIPSNRLLLVFKLLTGVSFTSSSGVESLSADFNNTPYFLQSKSDVSIPLQLGSDLRLDVGKSLSFIFFASLFYTSTHFKHVKLDDGFTDTYVDMNIPITSYQLGLGFGLKPPTENKKKGKRGKGMY